MQLSHVPINAADNTITITMHNVRKQHATYYLLVHLVQTLP